MIEAAMKDRQAIEYSQRFERLPHTMGQEAKAVIEEYGRAASKSQKEQSQTYANLKRDFEVQRKRTIQLIEEKAGLENELNQIKLVKKEQGEQLKEKTRCLKELQVHLELTTHKLEEAEKKAEASNYTIDEMSSQRAPVKDVLARQRQEIKVLKLNLSKIESTKQNVEKDLSLALLNHKKAGTKIEQLQLENQELKDLVEMKSNFIHEIQDRGSLAATAGVLTQKKRQTLMYLETIQRLSMYIVRKFKA